jgi:tetratricopeptide (TPR) repeat protein
MKGDLDNDAGFRVYAQTSLSLQKYADAIVGYSKLLELNPHDKPARFNLANAYYLNNEFTQAMQFYQQLYAQDPADEMLIYNIGETHARLGNYKKAIEFIEKTPRSRQRGAMRLAECYQKLGKSQTTIS